MQLLITTILNILNSPFVTTILGGAVGGAVAGYLLGILKEALDRKREFNRNVFSQLDLIMNEDQLITFLQDLHPINSIDTKEIERIKEFPLVAATVSNSFLSKRLNEKLSAFCKDLENLGIFIFKHFIPMDGTPSTELYLEPYFRTGRASGTSGEQLEIYHKYVNELSELKQSAEKTYKEYRTAIKNELKV